MTRDTSPTRCLPWFARDAAIWPLSLFAAVCAGITLITWRLRSGMGVLTTPETIASIQQTTWSTCLTVAILLATAGVVGVDLTQGFYRSWFAKPIAPWWYYLQRYLLGALVVLAAPLLFGAGLALTLHNGFGLSSQLMGTIALGYLLIGSAVFLLSIFTQRGWLLVFLIGVMQGLLGSVLRGIGQNAELRAQLWPPLIWLHDVLPPTDMIQPLLPALHGSQLAHVLLYGAGLLVAALVVLRYRPLGSGGRA